MFVGICFVKHKICKTILMICLLLLWIQLAFIILTVQYSTTLNTDTIKQHCTDTHVFMKLNLALNLHPVMNIKVSFQREIKLSH